MTQQKKQEYGKNKSYTDQVPDLVIRITGSNITTHSDCSAPSLTRVAGVT